MSDVQYITGIVKSAETITGISGASTFAGTDTRGYFFYDSKLKLIGQIRSRLLPSDIPEYDYIVDGSSGIHVRADWVQDIQTEVYWDQVLVDTEVQVSNDNLSWKNMYFAQYDVSSPDGKPYYVWVGGRTSFSTIGGSEITEITCKAANVLGGKYFLIYSPTVKYYVWFNIDNANSSPGSNGGPMFGVTATGIEVKLAGADTADIVAGKLKIIMDTQAEFRAMISPNSNIIVAVACRTAGKAYDASSGNSGLTIATRIQGGDKENYQYARIAP